MTNDTSNADETLPLAVRMNLLTKQIQDYYLLDSIPWVIGYSGGKDSTAVLQLVWYALKKLRPEQRHKPIHVITTDTMVENPVVSAWVKSSHDRMDRARTEAAMPIRPHMLYPDLAQTFWVNLIGRGYPSPRYKFRWCTERLKIRPSNRFIREVVRSSGEAMLVLGTRRAESSRRSANMEKHAQGRLRDRISPNSKLPNSLVYTPIEDWTSDDVWQFLMQVPNPWGHANRALVSMYRGASDDNECPLVVDTTTPSCGNSRFGCWVCTLVERDKSMEAMITNDHEKEWMMPLLELRNELDEPDHDKRDYRRMNGRVHLYETLDDNGDRVVRPIPGPYRKEWREHWLRRVLEAQEEAREEAPEDLRELELIRMEELREIRRIWREEKHEFDDSLPRIYEETTGRPFPRGIEDSSPLGAEEWEVLSEVCGSDEMLRDLSARLLNTARQYQGMARRVGVHKAIDRILEQRGFESQEDAVNEALRRRELRESSSEDQLRMMEKEVRL